MHIFKSLFDDLKSIAESRNCLVSGGSDFHGAFADVVVGEVPIQYENVERFLDAIGIDFNSIPSSEGHPE